MFDQLASLLKQGQEIQEVHCNRGTFGGVPARDHQHNWDYCMVNHDGKNFLRLGLGRQAFNFRVEGELSEQDFQQGKSIPLTRMADLTTDDMTDGGRVAAKGKLQVHKSTPTEIHATIQDGRRGSSFRLVHEKGQGWRMEPRAPKPKPGQQAGQLMEAIAKTAMDKTEMDELRQHHHLQTTCRGCGNVATCRCSAPKTNVEIDPSECWNCQRASKKAAADRSLLPFRESAEALLLDKDKVVGQFKPGVGGTVFLKLPGGGIDPGENTVTGLHRELMEEAGATPHEIQYHGHSSIIWPPEFGVNQPDKYNAFRGSKRHVFSGHLATQVVPTSTEGDALPHGARVPVKDVQVWLANAIANPAQDAGGTMLEHRKIQQQALESLLSQPKEAGKKWESWIGVDLDGTLAYAPEGGFLEFPGKPVKAMVDRIEEWIREGKTIKIMTARANTKRGRSTVRMWLRKNTSFPDLEVTDQKDPGMTHLYDDRAVQVERNTGKLAKLHCIFNKEAGMKGFNTKCPACGKKPKRLKIQGDAIQCSECRKCSDMEEWDKSASNMASYLSEEPEQSCLAKIIGLQKVATTRAELLNRIYEQRPKVNTSPTEAQREAGNYRKGHVFVQGLDVTIESPKGSTRSGTSKSGHKWSTLMRNDYGYIRNHPRSEADGDHVDVFVGPHPDSHVVFIVDQDVDGKFDEHKALVGWTNAQDAKQAYLDNFNSGWKGFRSITALTMKQFRRWLLEGDTSKPLAGQAMKDFSKHAKWNLADWMDSYPLVHDLPVAVGVGALRGAAVGTGAALLSRLYHKTREEPDTTNFPKDIAVGAGIGIGTGLLSHYTPAMIRFAQSHMPAAKTAHIMDIPLAPISTPNPMTGMALGTAYGAGAGAAIHGIKRLKRMIMGESTADMNLKDDVSHGAGTGLMISGMAQLMGQIPQTSATLPAPPKTADYNREWGLGAQIVNDPMIPSWRQSELLRDLDRAQSLGIQLTPQQLIAAGFVGLAGWMTAKAFGAGSFGQTMAGLGGAMLGASLNAPDSHTMWGGGFYRP